MKAVNNMEERTSIIAVGDEIKNQIGQWATVTEVIAGEYGLLIRGKLKYQDYEAYAPYEITPVDGVQWDYYGWAALSAEMTSKGVALTSVALWKDDPRTGIADYEAEWERTIEAIRSEEMGCVPVDPERM